MLEILHFCYQTGQIIFIRKNIAAELSSFNRCASQPAGSKAIHTWVAAKCRSMLHEDICCYLYLTQVYINYIFAGRQQTVRLSGKHLCKGLLSKIKEKKRKGDYKSPSLLFILTFQVQAGEEIENLDAQRIHKKTILWPSTTSYLLQQNSQAQYSVLKKKRNAFALSGIGLYI